MSGTILDSSPISISVYTLLSAPTTLLTSERYNSRQQSYQYICVHTSFMSLQFTLHLSGTILDSSPISISVYTLLSEPTTYLTSEWYNSRKQSYQYICVHTSFMSLQFTLHLSGTILDSSPISISVYTLLSEPTTYLTSEWYNSRQQSYQYICVHTSLRAYSLPYI